MAISLGILTQHFQTHPLIYLSTCQKWKSTESTAQRWTEGPNFFIHQASVKTVEKMFVSIDDHHNSNFYHLGLSKKKTHQIPRFDSVDDHHNSLWKFAFNPNCHLGSPTWMKSHKMFPRRETGSFMVNLPSHFWYSHPVGWLNPTCFTCFMAKNPHCSSVFPMFHG